MERIDLDVIALTQKKGGFLDQSELLNHPVRLGHSPENEEIDPSPDGSPPRADPVSTI